MRPDRSKCAALSSRSSEDSTSEGLQHDQRLSHTVPSSFRTSPSDPPYRSPLSAGLSRDPLRSPTAMDTDNPFTDTFTPPNLRCDSSLDDLDDAAGLSAFNHDVPHSAGGGPASQPWRIPPAIKRKQSQSLLGKEGSPLRWSYSSAGRVERTSLERNDTFNPTRRRLSVSSVSLDSLNTKAITPRVEASCVSPGDSGSITLPQLRVLPSTQAARLARLDAAADPYVN